MGDRLIFRRLDTSSPPWQPDSPTPINTEGCKYIGIVVPGQFNELSSLRRRFTIYSVFFDIRKSDFLYQKFSIFYIKRRRVILYTIFLIQKKNDFRDGFFEIRNISWYRKSFLDIENLKSWYKKKKFLTIKIDISWYKKNQADFYAPAWKVRRGFDRLSVRPSVIPPNVQSKCNIQSLGDDTVTKLWL